MGFIFAECGFKRRRRNKNTTRPGKPVARPTKAGSKLPESVISPNLQCSSGSSGPSEDVQLNKFNPHQNLISRESVVDTPKLLSESVSSRYAPDQVAPSFLNLPPEVLFRIYCFAGLAPENMLASTCTYFQELFNFTQNDYLLDMVVDCNFLLNLSESTTRDWCSRFSKKYDALPDAFNTPEVKLKAFEIPLEVAMTREAIDARIYEFPGITSRHVRYLNSRFGKTCVDRSVADVQQKPKRRYLEWKYMVLKKFVTLATEASNDSADVSPEQLLREAEAVEPCLSFKKTHNLDGFEPLRASTEIPPALYERVDAERLNLIGALNLHHNMPVGRPLSLVSSFFAHNEEFSQDKLDLLFQLCPVKLAREGDIAEALNVFEECRQRLFALPLETRQMHPLSDALDQLHDYLKECIIIYYEMNPHENSSIIWGLLGELSPRLLGQVLAMGVTVPLELF